MRRREFITLLGTAAAMWPLAARTQQPAAVPVIGWLQGGAERPAPEVMDAFRKGLSEAGYTIGRNVTIEARGAEQYNEVAALASELARRRVSVIFAFGTSSAQAAKAATMTIPIVFSGSGDPVKLGLVASLSRPGGNLTGFTSMNSELGVKRLELLREIVPQARTIGILTNPTSLISEGNIADIQAAAGDLRQAIAVFTASTDEEIDRAFAAAAGRRIDALLVDSYTFFSVRRERIVALAARYAIPTIYNLPAYVAAGELMSYGPDQAEYQRQAGIYVSRILKGDKPADLPVMQPTRFEFVINLKTAKALGLEVPTSTLLRATTVIE